jgi:uroporphyrinogen-III synthase
VSEQPLAGRRILVTRAAQQAGKLSDALRALGAEPVEVPVLEIRPPSSYEPLDRALRQLDQYEWLILTSANTVRVLAERASALQISTLQPPSLKVAAVGPATAAAAHEAGFQVTFVPESYVAESLIDGLLTGKRNASGHDFEDSRDAVPGLASGHDFTSPGETLSDPGHVTGHDFTSPGETLINPGLVTGHDFSRAESGIGKSGALAPALKGTGFSPYISPHKDEGASAPGVAVAKKRILLARAAIARDVIPDALRAAGASVDVVDAYRNVLPEAAPELLRQALAGGLDAATFTSSSSVTHLAEAARLAGIEFPFTGVPAISIGPITSRTLREAGWPPAAEANPPDISGLVVAVLQVFND